MATVLSLPRTLEKTSRLKQPTEGGVWAPLPNLKDLASALYIESDSVDLHVLKSVPHTWGHVHIFETALTDPGHPGHADAVGRWRALLAMLALRCEDGLSLSVRRCDLGARGKAFVEVVEEESPGRAAGEGWSGVHLIHAGEAKVLVGMLSPRTIVVPARDYAGSGQVGHAWARDGLRDPVEWAEHLTAHQLMMCSRFVAGIEETVKAHAGGMEKDLAQALAGLLKAFRSDLDGIEAGDTLAEPVQVAGRELVSGNDLPVLYEAVNRVWRLAPDHSGRSDSDANVVPGRTDGPIERVVLADETLQATWGKAPSRVYLFGSYMLADFLRDGNGFEKARAEAAEQGILLLRPEELLADDLTRVRGLKATEHPADFVSMLLPVTPVALLLWHVADLKERFGIVERDGGWDVTLRIEVEDRKGKRSTHHVTRRYTSRNEVDAPLALAAWPDFRAAEWRWNYLYGSSFNPARHSPRQSIVLATGVSGGILARDLVSFGDAGLLEQWGRLQKWGSGESPWGDGPYGAAPDPRAEAKWFETLQTHVPPAEQAADAGSGSGGDGSGHTKRLQRSDLPFEAALFAVKPDTRYAGLGILPPLRGRTRLDAKADVAIDFGTTNTIVYARVGGGRAKPVTFASRLRELERDEKRDDEYMQFMPTEEVNQPFPTVMQEREFEGVSPASVDLVGQEPMWRDFALFDASVQRMTETILSDSYQARVMVGFKWAMDADSRQRVVRYLGHIVLMSLAEVAEVTPLENAELRLSYPMTLPEGGRAYEDLVTKDVTKRVGVDVRF